MKRVLIVSYFFPPSTNMGSHRILRYVRHLREFGWEPVVLTTEFEGWTLVDERLTVPADIEVKRVRGVDLTGLWQKFRKQSTAQHGTAPSSSHGLTTFLNRWVMIPDKFFPWISPAARVGADLKFDAIYSTSDPLSDHLVARRISRQTGKPMVAEFRDLWLGSPYFARAHPTPLHRAWHTRLERQVLEQTSAVIGLSRGISRYFENNYRKPVHTIYNCYDPVEYPASASAPVGFTILYTGALYSSRSPEPFLAGFARFASRHPEARFEIAGGSSDLDLPAMIARHGLTGKVALLGRLPHEEVLRKMQSAAALLAIQSPEDDVHVPGKIFEYMGARRPIFAVSRPCETAELAAQAGIVAEPAADVIEAKLEELFQRGSAATIPDKFSVLAATRQLAAVLDEITRKR